MTNSFYEAGERRAARVKELFGNIASRYDLINDLQSFGLHRYWKRRVLKLARAGAGELALDLCCGTGDLAERIARSGARVLGVDFSKEMLNVAAERQCARRTSDSRGSNGSVQAFIQGDALQLPFPDRTFDLLTVAYGLRNLADLKRGLGEMRRVARPGARVLVLDFGKPENALWRRIYFAYLELFVPVLGRVFCGSASAYAYILESLRHYPAQTGVADLMREVGLINVRIINLLGGVMSIHYAETGRA